MCPGVQWYLDTEMLGDVLHKAKTKWNKPGLAVDYMPPEQTYSLFVNKISDSKSAVVLDAENYGRNVYAEETEYFLSELAPDYEFLEQMIDYYNKAEILMPSPIDYIQRNGGIPDGVKGTNLLDSLTNVSDIVESSGPIARYFSGYHVRGDDIITYWDTRVGKENIIKIDQNSRRRINPDKSDIRSDTAWFAKLYLDPALAGWTKPAFLVLNSLTYKERESHSITASKEYSAIAAVSILNSLEHHPFGNQVAKRYWRPDVDKYPITELDDDGLEEAMRAYQSSHSWQVEEGILESDPRKALDGLRGSWAAQQAVA
jgi:hypothetical protein